MKVAELEGAMLDYWVMRVQIPEGYSIRGIPKHYSTEWAIGGPIIERENITLFSTGQCVASNKWEAYINAAQTYDGLEGDFYQVGPTHLIAAMRAYVASKFGDEVADDAKKLDTRQTQQ